MYEEYKVNVDTLCNVITTKKKNVSAIFDETNK